MEGGLEDPHHKLYTQQEVEEMMARRRVEEARWERVNVIDKGFRKMEEMDERLMQRMDSQDGAIAEIKDETSKITTTFNGMGLDKLNPEQLAGVGIAGRKVVLDKEIKSIFHTSVGKILGVLVVLGPVLGVIVNHVWPGR